MKGSARKRRFWPFWNCRTTPPKRARPYRPQVEYSNEGKDRAVMRFVQRPPIEPTKPTGTAQTLQRSACAITGGGHLMPFSFAHLLTLTGLPSMQAVAPLCGVPENLIAVPDFGIFAGNSRL